VCTMSCDRLYLTFTNSVSLVSNICTRVESQINISFLLLFPEKPGNWYCTITLLQYHYNTRDVIFLKRRNAYFIISTYRRFVHAFSKNIRKTYKLIKHTLQYTSSVLKRSYLLANFGKLRIISNWSVYNS